VLVLGAAAAGYAALSKSSPRPRSVTTTAPQAAVPPSAAAQPTPTVPPPATTGKTPTPAVPVKPPKIPLTATIPKAGTKAVTPPAVTPPATIPPAAPKTTAPAEPPQPAAIVLDTNAASSYDPAGYPAASFGDPSLAIDGDTSTAWTAPVNPSTAPAVAEGLLIDLKSSRRIGSIELVTSTPGLTVQIFGSAAAKAPTTVTDKAWVKLTRAVVVHKRHAHLKLGNAAHGFRFITVWISRVPASAVGTPQAPGRISLNEVELFPAR
jgi:hypothetical protein